MNEQNMSQLEAFVFLARKRKKKIDLLSPLLPPRCHKIQAEINYILFVCLNAFLVLLKARII